MAEDDIIEDFAGEQKEVNKKVGKKTLLYVAISLVLAALAVALYLTMYSKNSKEEDPYKIIAPTDNVDAEQILYALPVITINLLPENGADVVPVLRLQLTFEFLYREQIEQFEALKPKIIDAIVFMLSNLKASEIAIPSGAYWLKEEILHRANLVLNPMQIENVYFERFDIKGLRTQASFEGDALNEEEGND